MVRSTSALPRLERQTAIRIFRAFGRMAEEAAVGAAVKANAELPASQERLRQGQGLRQEDRLHKERLPHQEAGRGAQAAVVVNAAVAVNAAGSAARVFPPTECLTPTSLTSAQDFKTVCLCSLGRRNSWRRGWRTTAKTILTRIVCRWALCSFICIRSRASLFKPPVFC